MGDARMARPGEGGARLHRVRAWEFIRFLYIGGFLMFLLLPLYRNFGLNDTHTGMILIYTVFSLPFSVWTMYAYFRQMPVELENAARVDGCSRWQVLKMIAVPLAAPGIVTAAVFAFIYAW